MNEYDPSEFEDPGFRSAVRRAAGPRESAPASLRAKVAGLLAAEAAAATAGTGTNGAARAAADHSAPAAAAPVRPGRRLAIGRDTWRTLAAAACVILAVGWMGLRIRSEFFPPRPIADASAGSITAIPASLVLEVVRTHDSCAKLPDHHKIPGDDPLALRDKLTQAGGVAPSVAMLGGEWKFKGAGVCTVGDVRAAHLLFARGEEYVSIFSMPSTGCGHGAYSYKDMVEKHPIAGFTRGDALYCVVGSCPKGEFTLDELDPVLHQVQGSIASGCMTHEAMVAAAAAPAPAGGAPHAHP